MPLDGIYGSTLSDHAHKGPNQAGNKSMLSYRSDVGVPGYTGYCPAQCAIVIPIKGFEHTGKPVDAVFKDHAITGTVMPEKSKLSEYNQGFKKVTEDTKPFTKSGGGYWFGQRKIIDNPKPFIATSIYNDKILNSMETATKQLDSSQGLTCITSGFDVARKRAQSSDPTSPGTRRLQLSPKQRPATTVTAKGEIVGYQTTSRSMVIDEPLIGGLAAAGKQFVTKYDPKDLEQRYQVMPRAMAPGMTGNHPTYRHDYGADCSDPLERGAPGEKFMSRLSTTRDLAEGTTRNTNRLPGYTGHLPVSKFHALARAQADGADEHINTKNDMMLYSLDQFSRTRLPGVSTFKPQAPSNITLAQPSQGSTILSSYGNVNHVATRNGVPPVDNTHYNNSKTGLMSYFTSAGEYISDNGIANAESFFKLAKPGDGRIKMSIPSKTNIYGSIFNPSNSLV